MSDALDVRAVEDRDAIAIVTEQRTWTFGDVAAAETETETDTEAVVATPEVATLLRIYAALRAHRPIALLHHRATPDEQLRQRAMLPRVVDDAAAVLFTSGSTGSPKGIVLSRAALLAAAAANTAHLGWRDDDRWLLALSTAHAGGLSIVVRCLVARRPVVLLEGDFDASRAAHLMRAARVTIASLVPTQLAALLDDATWRPPAHLRAVLLGGAAAPRTLLETAAARGVPFLTTYGMTESFGQVATAPLAAAGTIDPTGAVGVALPGVTLVAGTRDAPAPIRVRAPQLATRTLAGTSIAPELTTADLGWLDERGALHVVGRADDIIISGGENIHPTLIEAALLATPGVRAACAFGIADARYGQVVGVAIATTDSSFDLAAATAAWHATLPAHARPRRLAIVAALPLLPSGKLDRRAAAALPAQPLVYR